MGHATSAPPTRSTPSKTDPVEAIRALTDGFGADVVIEAVGRPETYEQAFYARDLAGTVVLVGVPDPDMTLDLPLIDFFGRGGALKSQLVRRLPAVPRLPDARSTCTCRAACRSTSSCRETIGLDEVEAAFDKMQHGEVLRSVVLL